jgi:hypothetical protein
MEDSKIVTRIQHIEDTKFIQIPGPNPILLPGTSGEWDDGFLEMCDIFKENDKYYLFYHATGQGEKYRIGVAIADHPLGPFVKYGDKPLLDLAEYGRPDDVYIACGSVIKELDKFIMFYSLQQKGKGILHIGIATSDNVLGPWIKSEKNPIISDFGYVGGITKKEGKYYLFSEYPINRSASDYGPLSVAVADNPEGPWTVYRDQAALELEDWGVWDDAGYSEANVKYDGNIFHMFYGGAKCQSIRMNTKESIGYAYSIDGLHFTKYSKNPVARRESIPYGAALAEVCFLMEHPFIYLYHTLRYTKAWLDEEKPKFPKSEHLGVQVLCVNESFTLNLPVYMLTAIEPGRSSSDRCKLPLNVENVDSIAVTASCRYCSESNKPMRVHVFTSQDGKSIDTVPHFSFDVDLKPGEMVKQTFVRNISVCYIQIVCENCDLTYPLTDISISLTMKKH